MQPMLDFQLAKQHRGELLREAEMDRQTRALRMTLKRRAGRKMALGWELRRHGGRLLKVLRSLGSGG